MGTWPSQYEQIDLLEIYHARGVRDHLLRDLRRLHETELPSAIDEARRERIREYYESMLISSAELLYLLGDRAS